MKKIIFGVLIGICFILMFISVLHVNQSKEKIATKCYDRFNNEIYGQVCLKNVSTFEQPYNDIFDSSMMVMMILVFGGSVMGVFD